MKTFSIMQLTQVWNIWIIIKDSQSTLKEIPTPISIKTSVINVTLTCYYSK